VAVDRLTEAFKEHGGRVYRYCLARTCSTHDAEELTAETFARFARDSDRIAARATYAWLARTSANLCIDHSRRRRRIVLSGGDCGSLWGESEPIARGDELPDTIADHADVWSALARLSAFQQQVVTLRAVEDLTFPDIALALGRSQGAVKMAYRRALDVLARMLKEAEDDGD
jgi:RNA polymerase sigma-70 factor (ECF subfamily)